MFFSSWALWEKMTFVSVGTSPLSLELSCNMLQVLGIAIMTVFAIGYGKLLWRNRLVRTQELVDEEKRMRIQELRNSGQIVDSCASHDIPFGVRAIQSGIQVDGIWISTSTTPMASELKLGYLRDSSSSDATGTLEAVKNSQIIADATTQIIRPKTGQGLPPSRGRESAKLDPAVGVQEAPLPERPDTAGTRTSYKPQKSSHLRFGSHGEFDEATLGQLEGKPAPKKIHSHRPRGSRHIEMEGDSASAADNERSSGTSSDSDTTLSQKIQIHPNLSRHSLLPQHEDRHNPSLSLSNVPSPKPVRSSLPLQSSKAEYFSIPIDSPGYETSDPFATPLSSPGERSHSFNSAQSAVVHSPVLPDSSWLDTSRVPPPAQSCSVSPFVPGELHVNKTVRKVNSGFEVLPAGTFGVPAEFKGNGVEQDQDEDSGERRQSKLQKKPRDMIKGRRPSSAMDRP
jgi:hypothetical protein